MAIEKEILKVVVVDDGGDRVETRVTSDWLFRKAPGTYGHILADIVRHLNGQHVRLVPYARGYQPCGKLFTGQMSEVIPG